MSFHLPGAPTATAEGPTRGAQLGIGEATPAALARAPARLDALDRRLSVEHPFARLDYDPSAVSKLVGFTDQDHERRLLARVRALQERTRQVRPPALCTSSLEQLQARMPAPDLSWREVPPGVRSSTPG